MLITSICLKNVVNKVFRCEKVFLENLSFDGSQLNESLKASRLGEAGCSARFAGSRLCCVTILVPLESDDVIV